MLSREQLRAAGVSDAAIDRAVANGDLHRVFRGVYARGHPRIGVRGRMRAAVLACGEETVVSHRSAAALLGLLEPAPAVVDVIAPGHRGRKLDGIRAHLVRVPDATEVGEVACIPCTSPARTLVDLAGTVGGWALRGAFERAAARRLLDLRAVETAIGGERRRGLASLRRLIEEWRLAAPVARGQRLRSPLEAKVLPLLAAEGLPAPRANARVRVANSTLEVDFLWDGPRLAVEADSRRHHDSGVAFERDRRRDRELTGAGYRVVRVTWLQAEREPEAVTAAIRAALGQPAH